MGSNIYNKPVDKNIFKVIAYVQRQSIRRLLYPGLWQVLIDQAVSRCRGGTWISGHHGHSILRNLSGATQEPSFRD